MDDTTFTGFPAAGAAFLADLVANNDKAWFDANRSGWDDALLAPAKAFVLAAGARLREFAPEVEVEPRVNGSIARINRDVRFSADKSPYKDHLDIMFWVGAKRTQADSLFFWRLTPAELILGAGTHAFSPDALARYRDAVADDTRGAELVSLVSELEAAGHRIGGEHYKRVPRGYSVEGEREPLIRHNALWAARHEPHPPLLSDAGLVDYCTDYWRQVAPLHRWILAELS